MRVVGSVFVCGGTAVGSLRGDLICTRPTARTGGARRLSGEHGAVSPRAPRAVSPRRTRINWSMPLPWKIDANDNEVVDCGCAGPESPRPLRS